MLKKILSSFFIIIIFATCCILFVDYDKTYTVTRINSPISFKLDDKDFIFKDCNTFDAGFTENNKILAKSLGINEEEAFILGHLGKYWSENFMKGRKVRIKNNADLIYTKYSYLSKLYYSGFCFIDSKPTFKEAFNKRLSEARKNKYMVLDLNSEKTYKIEEVKNLNLDNYIVIKRSHLNKILKNKSSKLSLNNNIKIFLTDMTTKFKPDRKCSADLCKEILYNIDNSQKSIDIAIYGYSKVPAIEEALKQAIKRGVKIRLVYDLDASGKNIYPDTQNLVSLIENNNNDGKSEEAKNIMHNKFYIFDNTTLITGSANLSHTDLSGFNSNSIIVLNSPEIARIYKQEFEQMLLGNFHNAKKIYPNKRIKLADTFIEVFFSPQDKSLTNAVIPLIKNAKHYIYIPTFVLTEKRVTEELIKAKNRGVEVKIIIDALNASIRHSKHQELRKGGLAVKTENFAGKMHSKSMIIDDKYTIIGSMNFSNSGENKNDENIVLIENPEIAKFYKDFFLYQWNKIDDKWLYRNVRAESKESLGSCYDGLDNNYDGLTDLEDPACK